MVALVHTLGLARDAHATTWPTIKFQFGIPVRDSKRSIILITVRHRRQFQCGVKVKKQHFSELDMQCLQFMDVLIQTGLMTTQ